MYRIGICDDDFAFGCQMEEYLKEYAAEKQIQIETEVFISGKEYLRFLDREPALDLLFLDIELEEKTDGILIGRKIRSDPAKEITQIVYVSARESYAMQLFQNRPMDFLIKPVAKEDVNKIMQIYRKSFSDRKCFFEYHIGKTLYRIADNEIMYFQCYGKKIRIITSKQGEKEFYGNMSYVEKQLNMSKFCTLHKSYIVNTDFVSEFHTDKAIMTTGQAIPISQSFRKKVQQRLLEMKMERWY